MNWPTHSDYQDAMQNPQVCFQEPELKTGEAATDMLGLPRVMSGNFASVYELRTTPGRWAIRCFVRQVPGQQGRYARLSQYLNSLNVPYLVKFEYLLKGILVKGEWYPIVKMQWVEGSPLNTYLEENFTNPQAMHKLASDFREMLKSMRELKIAHGDLQHGNIMVTPQGELRLVDYDGMYAPVFGRGRAPELGHANFQHPRRTADYYEEGLDNFSAIVLYTTFRALAVQPGLWDKFYQVDNLLLASSDYKAPLQSATFDALKNTNDPQVQQLAELLIKTSCAGVEQVPEFEEVMKALDEGKLDKLELRNPATAAAPEPFKQKLEALKTAAAATSGQYSGSRPVEMSRPAPAPPAPMMPHEEKGGLPPWLIWGAVGLAVVAIAFFIFVSQNSGDATPPPPPANPGSPAVTAVEAPAPSAGQSPGAQVRPAVVSPAAQSSIKLLGTLKGHAGGVEHLAFSQDGKYLATTGPEKALRVWDVNGGKSIRIINPEQELKNIAITPDGKNVAGVTEESLITYWDIATGKIVRTVTNYLDNLFVVNLAPTATMVAASAPDRRAFQLINLGSGSGVQVFGGHPSWIKNVSFSADGKFVAALCHDESVTIWDLPGARKMQTFVSAGNTARNAIVSPDGKHAAVVNEATKIKIYDLESGTVRQTFSHQKEIQCYAFVPGKPLLAASGDEVTIRIWNYATANNTQNLTGHGATVHTLAISRDGKLLASGSADGVVMLWEVH